MKRKGIVLSIVFVFGLLIAITPNHAKAATMPQYLWADSTYIIASVVDLGMLAGNEWEVVVVANWPGMPSIGMGMRFYYPVGSYFGMTFLADGYWAMFGYYGEWYGNGSVAYGRNNRGDVWERILYT